MTGQLVVSERPIHSVFALGRRDEDALSYALGFLLASSSDFCAAFLARAGVVPRRPTKKLRRPYSVTLQARDAFGRRDIVIGWDGPRTVIEAKIGTSQPTPEQLLRYVNDRPEEQVIVALTRDPLPDRTRQAVERNLNPLSRLEEMQWHEVLELGTQHLKGAPVGSEEALYLRDFVRFFAEDYEMKYYDVEVLIQDVNRWNAAQFTEGWMYCRDRGREKPLYFAPYLTRQNGEVGLSHLAQVLHVDALSISKEQGSGFQRLELLLADRHPGHWKQHWLPALQAYADAFADDPVGKSLTYYFLDEPICLFPNDPITKSDFARIPRNYGATLAEVLRRQVLGANSEQKTHQNPE